ncbi:MAG TPA: hypothetical protein VFK94_04315 [Patescibacteria group bacterium]|nr:hypothetical protein [Patescibacteria group bacterium]
MPAKKLMSLHFVMIQLHPDVSNTLHSLETIRCFIWSKLIKDFGIKFAQPRGRIVNIIAVP